MCAVSTSVNVPLRVQYTRTFEALLGAPFPRGPRLAPSVPMGKSGTERIFRTISDRLELLLLITQFNIATNFSCVFRRARSNDAAVHIRILCAVYLNELLWGHLLNKCEP